MKKENKEAYQRSKMEIFVKIIDGWQPLTIFAISTIVDVWKDSEYASRVMGFACFRFCLGFFKQNCYSVSVTIKCPSKTLEYLDYHKT